MRHISIDWNYPLGSERSKLTRWIDELIARVLNDVERHLPKLKSLKEALSTSHFAHGRTFQSKLAVGKLV